MRKKHLLLTSLVIIIILGAAALPVQAARGLPNTAAFGYGVRLDMWGQDVFTAIELAASMGVDWIAVDVDWNRHWPSLDQTADFSALDRVLQAARAKNLQVMLSLTNAPSWAITPNGPEPNYTNALLQSILNVYPDVIQAVELFPGMNQTSRWGAPPNPQAYLSMLQTVQQGCNSAGRSIHLITTLEPLTTNSSDGSQEDQVFLDNLYRGGGSAYMTIIGIRYPSLMGAPMGDQSDLTPVVLRRYEVIRSVMLNHQHANGLIWITGFGWPTSGTPNPADPLAMPSTPTQQAQWVNQALQLVRAQLFIGTAFFSNINQSTPGQTASILLLANHSLHPASVTISRFAGGNISSTNWSAPEAATSGSNNILTAAPATVPTYTHYEGKPRK